jgi:hypothetical protein
METTPKPGSQCHTVLTYLKRHGSITAMQAMTEFRCYRLAARIKDLRDMGYEIETHTEEHANGTHARYELRITDHDLEAAGQMSMFASG